MGFAMDTQSHWDRIYTDKAPTAVSWYRPHLETSLSFIERVGSKESAIIDIGGGESTLVDDLLSHGFKNITVLDISQIALASASAAKAWPTTFVFRIWFSFARP